MSGLSEQDRGELLQATHFSHQTCEHIAPAVERIVARHVAAALNEAADAFAEFDRALTPTERNHPMSTYRIFFTQTASASAEVEADDFEQAVDLAYEKVPGDVCAQCGGWGRDYSLELGGEWTVDESGHEVDGEWVEVQR